MIMSAKFTTGRLRKHPIFLYYVSVQKQLYYPQSLETMKIMKVNQASMHNTYIYI